MTSSPPPPEFSVRPGVWIGDDCERLRLVPYLTTDGDYTNQIIDLGVKLATEDRVLLDIGLYLVVPPRLFWLLNLLRIP